ncbi:MAG TPA: hypothetical protein DEG43_01770 [Acidimicrobiaceae bacterium]|jgi:hypothetical protein|nr:hypothetical protein [Acidimicrobiaceae bacterium]
MRHVQLHLAKLRIYDRDLPLRYATLQVVSRSGEARMDWEVVATTAEEEPVATGVHPLRCELITGADENGLLSAEVSGDALFVRRVEQALVFRGESVLTGWQDSWLPSA